MRLIATFSDKQDENEAQERAYQFSYYLKTQDIKNDCEEAQTDSGSIFNIWIYDEDQLEDAQAFLKKFETEDIRVNLPPKASLEQLTKPIEEPSFKEDSNPQPLKPTPYGKLSLLILAAVILIFFASIYQRPKIPNDLSGIPKGPNLSKVEKNLIYDYPLFFQLRDQLLTIFTPTQIQNGQTPSAEAKQILSEMKRTTYWEGFYDMFVQYLTKKRPNLNYDGPIFEKIKQGEVWRLFTPVLLHLDLLHIFFNVLWFILLGNQIEHRLGSFRFFILLVVGAVVPNTAQYLMSGPFFMGLSGIITTLAGFIWARLRKAPWEGYLVSRATLLFLLIFIVGIFMLQVVLFFLELFGKLSLPIGIANTAHLVGFIIGYLLGQSKLFAVKHAPRK